MAQELKTMKNEQQRFAQVVKDTALKTAEKQKIEKEAIEARIAKIRVEE